MNLSSPDPKSKAEREPIRVELAHVGAAPVVHVHEPAPLAITDRNCSASAGLTLRAWRKVGRAMLDAGYVVSLTSDGMTAARVDVEQWLRERAPKMPVEETSKPAEMSDAAMLKKLRGGK